MKNASEVESLFTQKASTWNEKYSVNGPLRYRLDAFKTQLSELVMPLAKVLDFGCGTGNLAGHLNACGFAVSACDISAKMIDRARENNPGALVDWFVLSADWQRLPFASNIFDAIVASSSFEYITAIDMTLVECWRILKPGGYLIATVPNNRHIIRKLETFLRPMATLAHNLPVINRIQRFNSYATYLRCSRNRMPLDEWFAIGNRVHFTVIDQDKTSASKTALAFIVFRKADNKSQQPPKNHQK